MWSEIGERVCGNDALFFVDYRMTLTQMWKKRKRREGEKNQVMVKRTMILQVILNRKRTNESREKQRILMGQRIITGGLDSSSSR